MRNAILIAIISVLLVSCFTRKIETGLPKYLCSCCKEIDTIPISKLIKNIAYYWKIDSLGNNGYRRGSSVPLRITKIYDVDYSFVKTYFGVGLHYYSRKDNQEYLYLYYWVFNTEKMEGDYWKKLGIKDEIVFKFDRKTEKLISVNLITD